MNNVIINPGSENKGGTFEQALTIAKEWHENILSEFPEVTMSEKGVHCDGLWMFEFKHQVTGVTVHLQTHGFTREQCEKFIFQPRVYWNGSSTGDPRIEDWLTDEFTYRVCYEKIKRMKL